MVDNKMNKQTFLYQFLIEPRYRIARHILLLAAVTAVSLNQNIYTFGARIEQLGNQVYLAGLCTLISYFIVGYLHLYLLVPKLLLKKSIWPISFALPCPSYCSFYYDMYRNTGYSPHPVFLPSEVLILIW